MIPTHVRRQQILATAAAVERHRVSLAAVAETLGVSRTLIVRIYRNRQVLLAALDKSKDCKVSRHTQAT